MNDTHDQEPTLQDVLDAVNESSTAIENRLQKIEGDISGVKSDVTSLKSDVTSLKSDLTSIKSSMVTKDYLDDKIADLKGDLVLLMRKEDTKLRALVEVSQKRKIITEDDVKQILSMDPFPQTP